LIVAQTSSQQQQELLKTALSKQVDVELAAAEIIPTNTLPDPKPNDIPLLDEALHQAAQNRPELEQAEINIRNQEITIQSSRNALLPRLDAFATYAPQGLSGVQLIRANSFGGPVLSTVPGGISQSFSQTFHGRFPDYSYGLQLQVPLRNRSAQADAARALLEERQLRTTLQQRKNQIAQDVRNANIAVVQAKAQIDAASKAVVLAQQTLDAEQKKFQLGESTVFLVIQAQRDLATAEGNAVKAHSTYAKALTQFAQATGTTLEKNGIELAEAKTGQVPRAPNIPGTPSSPSSGQAAATSPTQ
jgi:outer membrane protein TolC